MKRNKWLLLAEDDEQTAELTVLVLNSPNKVVVARDGLEALDCLHHRGAKWNQGLEDTPTLVLLDLKMPRVNGFEVLRQIKSDPRLKGVPVVMFTSSREGSDLNRSYDLGANAYVVKPVDFQEFNEVLQQISRFWMTVNETPPTSVANLRVHSISEQAVGVLPV
jgi:CheY-like chemotaxis protein